MKSSRQELQELRVEAKYLLSHDQARQLRPLLRRRLALDAHGAAHPDAGYDVHSVYLDSNRLHTYWAALKKEKDRAKLRIRFYDDDHAAPAYVEVKTREGGQTIKRRCPVRRDQLGAVIAGRVPGPLASETAPEGHSRALQHFIGKLLKLDAGPKLHIAYRREAYVSKNSNAVRVTLDRDVRSEPVTALRLTTAMRNPQPLCGNNVVLEVKVTGPMPPWLRQLVAGLSSPHRRFAKYVFSVQQHGLHRQSQD